jgi:hypothetical protein
MKKNIKLLTEQDKKILRSFSRYAQSWGLNEVVIRIEDQGEDLEDMMIPNHFDNAYSVKFPKPLHDFLTDFKNRMANFDLIESPDVDDLNYEVVEIRIDVEDEHIEFIHDFSYTRGSEVRGTSWDIDEDKDELEPLFDAIKSEDPSEDYFELRYYGSGDSGYIEDSFEGGGSVPEVVEDWCYRKLEGIHGGWEINEGSSGKFYFDLEQGVINLEHTEMYEENESDTFYTESFAK